jgi:hypothetical protein
VCGAALLNRQAECPLKPLATPAHNGLEARLHDLRCKRDRKIHPPLPSLDVNIEAQLRPTAGGSECPPACTYQVAARPPIKQLSTLDPEHLEVEEEGVRHPAAPSLAQDGADAAIIAPAQHINALNASPPGWPGGIISQNLPDPVAPGGCPPYCQETISSHSAISFTAR